MLHSAAACVSSLQLRLAYSVCPAPGRSAQQRDGCVLLVSDLQRISWQALCTVWSSCQCFVARRRDRSCGSTWNWSAGSAVSLPCTFGLGGLVVAYKQSGCCSCGVPSGSLSLVAEAGPIFLRMHVRWPARLACLCSFLY